jgi:hypothetical protein
MANNEIMQRNASSSHDRESQTIPNYTMTCKADVTKEGFQNFNWPIE